MKRPCEHCGFKGPIEKKGSVTIYKETEYITQVGADVEYDHIVDVYRCPACGEATVDYYVWFDEIGEPVLERTLYPTLRDNSALPQKVRQRLDAARRVKKADPSFYAVGIRRMLETVANDKEAKGKDLFAKLDDLVAKDLIPAPLAKAAHQLRQFGNWGAHDEEVEVDEKDVPAIADLADAILEYLYRAPAKIAAVEKSLKKREKSIKMKKRKA